MSSCVQKSAPDNYADVAKYIDWINKTILDNGGMSSCGYTIAAVQTAETTDTIESTTSSIPITTAANQVFGKRLLI